MPQNTSFSQKFSGEGAPLPMPHSSSAPTTTRS